MIEFKEIKSQAFDVEIQASNPFTEIYVIDSEYNRVGSFLGSGYISLRSGTYTVRFQEGDVIRDEIVFIEKSMKVTDPTEDNTEIEVTKRDFENRNIIEISDSIGSIRNFLRIPSANKEVKSIEGEGEELTPWLNFTNIIEGVDKENGNKISCRYTPASIGGNTGTLEVFFLKGDIQYQISLIQHASWQVFVEMPNDDLSNLTISLLTEDQLDFDHYQTNTLVTDRYYLHLSRLALQAMVSKRSVVSREALKFLTNSKWTWPWHGLLALHLQTFRTDPNIDLIEIMLGNLSHIYGSQTHPDIAAIRWWLLLREESKTTLDVGLVSTPPALSNSWKLLLQAHSLFPEKVFSTGIIDTHEKYFEVHGPWLFENRSVGDTKNLDIVVQSTRAVIGEQLYLLVRSAEKKFGSSLNDDANLNGTNITLFEFIRTASIRDYPVTTLVSRVFEGTEDFRQLLKIDFGFVIDFLESPKVRSAIMLATGHTLEYLLSINSYSSTPPPFQPISSQSDQGDQGGHTAAG